MKKFLVAATAALSLLGTQAIAQTTATTPASPDGKTTTVLPKTSVEAVTVPGSINYYSKSNGAWRASKLIGVKVVNTAGETVGDINEIVLDGAGKATAAVIGVGGFLGMGEHEVAVNFDSLQVARDKDGKATVTLNVTKDTLKAALQWKWST